MNKLPEQPDFDRVFQEAREALKRVKIIKNSAKCLRCGDEIESCHRHDFRSCSCGSVSVDGGKDYLRRCFASQDCYEDTSICQEIEEEVVFTKGNRLA